MGTATDLLDRTVYGVDQVDGLVGLTSGTARRWIDGYDRGGKTYPPVVREETTGDELVTWGEFLETRLLAEYRDAGVPMIHMRPAVSELRKRFQRRYPLAHASAFLDVDGKELVMSVQEEVRLEKALYLVVVRNNQLVLAPPTERFVQSTDFGNETRIAERLYPLPDDRLVMMDPRRQFGQPVVRSVPTAVIAEQVRAGDPIDMIVGLYELTRAQVESAIRYELIRGKPTLAAA